MSYDLLFKHSKVKERNVGGITGQAVSAAWVCWIYCCAAVCCSRAASSNYWCITTCCWCCVAGLMLALTKHVAAAFPHWGRLLCKKKWLNISFRRFRGISSQILSDLIRITSYGACLVGKMFLPDFRDDKTWPHVFFWPPSSTGFESDWKCFCTRPRRHYTTIYGL